MHCVHEEEDIAVSSLWMTGRGQAGGGSEDIEGRVELREGGYPDYWNPGGAFRKARSPLAHIRALVLTRNP